MEINQYKELAIKWQYNVTAGDVNIKHNRQSNTKLHTTGNIGIPTLKTPNKMCNHDYDKAQALNSHFESVFNTKTNQGIPNKGPSPYPSISHLQISTDGVAITVKKT